MGVNASIAGSFEGSENVVKRDLKFAHMMKIHGISALYRHGIEKVESSVFEVCGYKWKFHLYPMGRTGRGDHVSLFVEIQETDAFPANWSLNVNLRLFALKQFIPWNILASGVVCFSSSNSSGGAENFLPFDQISNGLYGYVLSDTAVFGAEIIVTNQRNVPRAMGTAEYFAMIERPANSKFTWKITKFSSFDLPKHFSHSFPVGQRKWKIGMYPKGNEDVKGNWLSVFLMAFDYTDNALKAKTYAKFKLRLLDQLYCEHREFSGQHYFDTSRVEFRFNEFMPLKDLYDQSKGFLVNDMMYIQAEFEVVSLAAYF